MPKQNRKRRHESISGSETDAPKSKFRSCNEETQAEEQLSKILFGGSSNFLQSLEEAEQEAGMPNIDSGVGEDDSGDSIKEVTDAWYDSEDDGIEVGHALDVQGRKLPTGGFNDRSNKYSNLLKNKFKNVMGTPSWASFDDAMDLDDISGVRSLKANLSQNTLEYKKLKDLNCASYAEGPFVEAVEFHPTSTAALVAGSSGITTLYAVDGRHNSKLHSVEFKNFPVFCAKFSQNGDEAILGSRYSYIYSYDLMTAQATRISLPPNLNQFKKFVVSPDYKYIAAAGKWGEVHILSALSKERITILKQDSEVTALEYNSQSNILYGHSDAGEVTVWDMKMKRVKHKFVDEGCLQGTTLSLSPSNQFLATGSAQGVVNLYDVEDVLTSKLPKPRKTIFNLTTSINNLKFNSSSEILALSSGEVKNALKLFHVGSGCVFSNFETKLGQVNILNFSPNSGYIAFGNRKSTVALYRLKHYKNY